MEGQPRRAGQRAARAAGGAVVGDSRSRGGVARGARSGVSARAGQLAHRAAPASPCSVQKVAEFVEENSQV